MSSFYYEHLGHMQISLITLHTYQALVELTGGQSGVFTSWDLVKQNIWAFPRRLVQREMGRFCYGVECIEVGVGPAHRLALTELGLMFLEHLIAEAPYQASELAILLRPAARRRQSWNTMVQESTFFNSMLYQTIKDFGFHPGPARDFLRCIHIDKLREFLTAVTPFLSPAPSQPITSLETCIKLVQTYGKYWSGAGGAYSWFVFPQIFRLELSDEDWSLYDQAMASLIRPPEWGGGGRPETKERLIAMLGVERLERFHACGILRPVSTNFCLTSPGYLMWERKKKGFILELRLRKLNEDTFEVALCNAADMPGYLSSRFQVTSAIPSLRLTCPAGNLADQVCGLLLS